MKIKAIKIIKMSLEFSNFLTNKLMIIENPPPMAKLIRISFNGGQISSKKLTVSAPV